MIQTPLALLRDLLRLLSMMVQSRTRLVAENLFLRKQLACYLERGIRPRRTDNASRIATTHWNENTSEVHFSSADPVLGQ